MNPLEKLAVKIFLVSGRWSFLGIVFWGCEGKAALATALLRSAKQQWGTESCEYEREVNMEVKFVKFFTVFTDYKFSIHAFLEISFLYRSCLSFPLTAPFFFPLLGVGVAFL